MGPETGQSSGSSSYRPSTSSGSRSASEPADGGGTHVELTHSGWEKLGEAAADLRARYDRGWVAVFERGFGDYAT